MYIYSLLINLLIFPSKIVELFIVRCTSCFAVGSAYFLAVWSDYNLTLSWHANIIYCHQIFRDVQDFVLPWSTCLPQSLMTWLFHRVSNRPSVAGAVLQTPLWFIYSVTHWVPFSSQSSKHHNSQIVRARDLKFLHNVHHPLCVMWHASNVTCHMWHVMCKKNKKWWS